MPKSTQNQIFSSTWITPRLRIYRIAVRKVHSLLWYSSRLCWSLFEILGIRHEYLKGHSNCPRKFYHIAKSWRAIEMDCILPPLFAILTKGTLHTIGFTLHNAYEIKHFVSLVTQVPFVRLEIIQAHISRWKIYKLIKAFQYFQVSTFLFWSCPCEQETTWYGFSFSNKLSLTKAYHWR